MNLYAPVMIDYAGAQDGKACQSLFWGFFFPSVFFAVGVRVGFFFSIVGFSRGMGRALKEEMQKNGTETIEWAGVVKYELGGLLCVCVCVCVLRVCGDVFAGVRQPRSPWWRWARQRADLKVSDHSNESGCNDLVLHGWFPYRPGETEGQAGGHHTYTHTHTHTCRIK